VTENSLLTKGGEADAALRRVRAKRQTATPVPVAQAGPLPRSRVGDEAAARLVILPIWDKPGPLTRAEFGRVELHPMLTQQILRRSPALAALNPVAAAHHEKADGSGYHKRLRADAVDPGVGVLAAADIYVGLTSDRADRPAFSGTFAVTELRRLASHGVLEQRPTEAVLVAAGHDGPPAPEVPPAPAPRRAHWLRGRGTAPCGQGTHHQRDRQSAPYQIKYRRPPHRARLHQDRGTEPGRRRPVDDATCRRPLREVSGGPAHRLSEGPPWSGSTDLGSCPASCTRVKACQGLARPSSIRAVVGRGMPFRPRYDCVDLLRRPDLC
jgi:HD domain